MTRKLDPASAATTAVTTRLFELRVGDRFVPWISSLQVPPARNRAPALVTTLSPPSPACTFFGAEPIVLARIAGPHLPITSVVGLARQFRRALMSFADQPVAEVISGHRADGAPAEVPHLAVVPLPAVTGSAPDGTLRGVALVLPRDLAETSCAAVLRALERFEHRHDAGPDAAPAIPIVLGNTGVLVLQRVATAAHADELRPATWIGPARRWVSVTPIALDRNPANLDHIDQTRRQRALRAAMTYVVDAVQRIGLPAPIQVDVLHGPDLLGTPAPHHYPRFPPAPRGPRRLLVHARLQFTDPVMGPMLLGAGRFHGLGLLMPSPPAP